MTKEILISEYESFQEKFYKKAEKWFVKELGKICIKHNVSIQDYGILRIFDNETEESYEPYTIRYDEDRIKRFEDITIELESIVQVLYDVDYRYQAYNYSDEQKMLY